MSADTIAAHCRTLFGHLDGTGGWVEVGIGSDPYVSPTGKVEHRSWEDRPFAWPRQAEAMIDFLAVTSVGADVYVTPGMRTNPTRNLAKTTVLPVAYLWAEVDGDPAGAMKLRRAVSSGGLLVASGRGVDHLHGYVRLTSPAPASLWPKLNRRFAEYVGGDVTPSAPNGYLRPAGSWNHKPRARGGEPVPVVLEVSVDGPGRRIEDLDVRLPEVLCVDPLEVEAEAIDDDRVPQAVRDAMKAPLPMNAAGTAGDRSAGLWRLCMVALEQGLTNGEVLTLARRYKPARDKYGDGDRLDRAVKWILATDRARAHRNMYRFRRDRWAVAS
jgi:hypothetical protein